jgi:hypothetical protein
MTVRVRSVPPCVSSQIGSRHLPLKQGIVSSSLTWRTNLSSGCGVTQHPSPGNSWRQFNSVLPDQTRIVGPDGSRHGVANAETPVRFRYDAPNPFYAPVAQLEERDASKPGSPARHPRWGGRTSRLRVQVLPGVPLAINSLTPQLNARVTLIRAGRK